MTNTLDQKLDARVGRVQLIVADFATLARAIEHAIERGNPKNLDELEDELYALVHKAAEYGAKWADETADLLKEKYNRLRDL